MSIRPEPSVVGAVVGSAVVERLRARHRERLQVRKREQHRVLVALSGQVLDPAAVVASHRRRRRRHRCELGQFDAVECALAEPNRSPPEDGAAARGRREDVRAAAVVTEQRSVRAGAASAAASLAAAVGRRRNGAVRGEHIADVDRPAVGRRDVRELGDRRQLQPVGETFFPDVRVAANLAALDARADVGFGDRTDLLALDHDVPAAVGSRCGGGRPRPLRPAIRRRAPR